jgi:glycosyltransferase involved in cell wall biosynthesis
MHILLIHTDGFDVIGGANFHTIYLYKTLFAKGAKIILLVSKNSKMEDAVKEEHLPYETIQHSGILKNKLCFKIFLIKKMLQLCNQFAINIIVCCNKTEVWSAKIVRAFIPIKIVYNRHNFDKVAHRRLRDLDGALGSGYQTVEMLNSQNKKTKNSIKHIDMLPMFFNQEKFLTYKSNEDCSTFFQKNFNIAIPKGSTLLCTVANLYANTNHKNYPLLFKAIAKINQISSNKIFVVLVGKGPAENFLKAMVKDLGLFDQIFFVGFTSQLIPGILYHSDIFVLPSKEEAFGIVYLEAALMKKPLIGATKTGAENTIIFHGITGLLFENDNVESLVMQILRLISDVPLRYQLGQNAYNYVKTNYSNEIGAEKMLNLFKKITTNHWC